MMLYHNISIGKDRLTERVIEDQEEYGKKLFSKCDSIFSNIDNDIKNYIFIRSLSINIDRQFHKLLLTTTEMEKKNFNQLLKELEVCKDVTPVVKSQKSTLLRYEEINEMLRQFLELSHSTHGMLLENYTTHTKTLVDLKKDLESSFRRIRSLKSKLKEEYPGAFEATSAAIQELEDKNKQFQGEDTDNTEHDLPNQYLESNFEQQQEGACGKENKEQQQSMTETQRTDLTDRNIENTRETESEVSVKDKDKDDNT